MKCIGRMALPKLITTAGITQVLGENCRLLRVLCSVLKLKSPMTPHTHPQCYSVVDCTMEILALTQNTTHVTDGSFPLSTCAISTV